LIFTTEDTESTEEERRDGKSTRGFRGQTRIEGCLQLSGLPQPVLMGQTGNLAKLSLVVADDGVSESKDVGGD